MIIRTLAIGGTLAASLALAAAPAQAEYGRHAAFAAGAVGGAIAGAAIAGAAAPSRTYYSGPAAFDVYDEAPAPVYQQCYFERRQVFVDQARYVWKNVRVCE